MTLKTLAEFSLGFLFLGLIWVGRRQKKRTLPCRILEFSLHLQTGVYAFGGGRQAVISYKYGGKSREKEIVQVTMWLAEKHRR